MREQSEQEMLASLIGNGDLEPIVTGDILEQNLREQLSGIKVSKKNYDEDVSIREYEEPQINDENSNIDSSQLIKAISVIRENLMGVCGLDSNVSSLLADEINNLGNVIRYLGGSVEEFDPLDYMSGLGSPDNTKNAEEVIKRTIQCYKMGKISNAKIKNDGREINISFQGETKDIKYVASGIISSSNWIGNEAIDYVYTPSSGRMTVKSFENGRWVNKSENGDYDIAWELKEENKKEEITQTSNNKTDISEVSSNEEDMLEEGDIGDPIN